MMEEVLRAMVMEEYSGMGTRDGGDLSTYRRGPPVFDSFHRASHRPRMSRWIKRRTVVSETLVASFAALSAASLPAYVSHRTHIDWNYHSRDILTPNDILLMLSTGISGISDELHCIRNLFNSTQFGVGPTFF